MTSRFIAYYRVSTAGQGKSGLGLDAQRSAVTTYLNGGSWDLIGEFVEIESGKDDGNRPQLQAALERCRLTGAKLVIAKLDRLSRDVHFLTGLERGGVEFVACDMPTANRFTVHIMAAVAQQEREAISTRTKDALASIKSRLDAGEVYVSKAGRTVTRLGNPNGIANTDPTKANMVRKAKADEFAQRLAPTVADLRKTGLSLAAIADRLDNMHVQTRRGGAWDATQVKRILDRVAA